MNENEESITDTNQVLLPSSHDTSSSFSWLSLPSAFSLIQQHDQERLLLLLLQGLRQTGQVRRQAPGQQGGGVPGGEGGEGRGEGGVQAGQEGPGEGELYLPSLPPRLDRVAGGPPGQTITLSSPQN